MKFDTLQPGDILTPTALIANVDRGSLGYVKMWASKDAFLEASSKGFSLPYKGFSLFYGALEAYRLYPGDMLMVSKVKLNKSCLSYMTGYSLPHQCAVFLPLVVGSSEGDLKRVAKAQKSAKLPLK